MDLLPELPRTFGFRRVKNYERTRRVGSCVGTSVRQYVGASARRLPWPGFQVKLDIQTNHEKNLGPFAAMAIVLNGNWHGLVHDTIIGAGEF